RQGPRIELDGVADDLLGHLARQRDGGRRHAVQRALGLGARLAHQPGRLRRPFGEPVAPRGFEQRGGLVECRRRGRHRRGLERFALAQRLEHPTHRLNPRARRPARAAGAPASVAAAARPPPRRPGSLRPARGPARAAPAAWPATGTARSRRPTPACGRGCAPPAPRTGRPPPTGSGPAARPARRPPGPPPDPGRRAGTSPGWPPRAARPPPRPLRTTGPGRREPRGRRAPRGRPVEPGPRTRRAATWRRRFPDNQPAPPDYRPARTGPRPRRGEPRPGG